MKLKYRLIIFRLFFIIDLILSIVFLFFSLFSFSWLIYWILTGKNIFNLIILFPYYVLRKLKLTYKQVGFVEEQKE